MSNLIILVAFFVLIFALIILPGAYSLPQISIVSPDNINYVISDIPLSWSIDEPITIVDYSIDGATNQSSINLSVFSIFENATSWSNSTVCDSDNPCNNSQNNNWSDCARLSNVSNLDILENLTITQNIGEINFTMGAYQVTNLCPFIEYWNYSKSDFSTLITGTGSTCTSFGDGHSRVDVGDGLFNHTINVPNDGFTSSPLQLKVRVGTSALGEVRGFCEGQVIAYNYTNTTITVSDGSHNLTLYATNTSGDLNSSNVNFTVDTTAPSSTSPVFPASVREATIFTIFITLTDSVSDVDSAWVDIFGVNNSMTNTTNIYSVSVVSPNTVSTINYPLVYYYNDTVGNEGSENYTLDVTNVEGGSGSGEAPPGGVGGVITICGGFDVVPSQGVSLASSPGTETPQIPIRIFNGNESQQFTLSFNQDMKEFCTFAVFPLIPVPAGGQIVFELLCVAPDELLESVSGNIIIKTDTGCEEAIPIVVTASDNFISKLGDFFRLLSQGNMGAFEVDVNGVPMILVLTLIISISIILAVVLIFLFSSW